MHIRRSALYEPLTKGNHDTRLPYSPPYYHAYREQLAVTQAGQLGDLMPFKASRDLRYPAPSPMARWSIHCSETADWYARSYEGTHGYGTPFEIGPFATPEAALAALTAWLRTEVAREACRRQWEDWCDRLEEEARQQRTARDLLRLQAGRDLCRRCVKDGKAYSKEAEELATRRVVKEAVRILAARVRRNQDYLTSFAARRGEPGRIARRLDDRRREQKEEYHARIRRHVQEVVFACYRFTISSWAGGEHEAEVVVGDHVSASGGSERAWSKNGKWSGRNSWIRIRVREDWLDRVYARDLERLDDMLTLDAEFIQGVGPELYKAAWLEQGRGFDVKVVYGYIARGLDAAQCHVTYHAPSARAALDGLARKLGTKPPRRQGVIDLDRLARRHGDLQVFWEDREGIACDSGTRSWCHAVGIDPDGCTVADVVRGYKLRPMPEAIKVLRRVVRDRNNPARQPVDLDTPPSAIEGEGTIRFGPEGDFWIEPSAN